MGLDVGAYRKIKKIDCVFDADGEPIDPKTREPIDDYFKPYINSDFPERAEDIEHKAVYSYEEYEHFWSGGYGRYNDWRESLAKLVGYTAVPFERVKGYPPSTIMSHQVGAFEVEEGPFHELICFSDCEGVIGTAVSKKLLKDFQEWEDRAKALGEYFYSKYKEWLECFAMAADDGAVDFH